MMGEGEWKRKKLGAEYRRQLRKLHIGVDAQTLEIRAIELTFNSVADAPLLHSQLGQIDPLEALLSVSGDAAHDTKVRIPLMADSDSKLIADSVLGDVGFTRHKEYEVPAVDVSSGRLKNHGIERKRDMKTTIVATLVAGLVASSAWAGWDESMTAFQQGRYALAYKECKDAAIQGDSLCQFAIGDSYEKGRGVPQDYQQAVAWYRKAAEQGNADAQCSLGAMYEHGRGVSQDRQRVV